MKLKQLQDADAALGQYAKTQDLLTSIEIAHNKAIAQVDKKFAAKSKSLSKLLASLKTAVENFILANKDRLFNANSRSLKLLNGTIGLREAKSPLEITDRDKTMLLIRKYFPDRASLAIRQREELAKTVLHDWSDSDLLKVGITREEKAPKPWFEPNDKQTSKRANNASK
jgi:phage host-nuclease inhibitor protein Gam